MADAETINVEVAYAKPEEQFIIPVEIPAGATLRQAVEMSHLAERCPEIDVDNMKVGIFGKLKKADQVLQAGDRVEIYRPLIADPKEVRRQRAAAGKKMKKGGGSLGDE
jgi:putative ubiquitin-RnfH superfamily antitoxin RatB of RatAB toxin-antitoxin module